MIVISRYRTALSHPGIARVMTAAFVCRLLSGMVSLALLLAAREASGSYADAGSVVGAYAVALALASPFWGRFADRRTARTALALSSSLQSLSFGLFVLASATSAWSPLLTVTALFAGATTPPAAAISSATFMAVVDDENDRRTLFALSGLLTESVFVVGPLIVAGIVAVLSPIYAIVITALVSAGGVWWLRAAAAVRRVDRLRPSLAPPKMRFGWNRPQMHVLLVVVAAAFAIGGVQVSLVAHAGELDVSAGVFLALLAVGGTTGSFLYGGMRLPWTSIAQLGLALGLYGGFILTLGTGPGLLLSMALVCLIGFVNGPADALESLLIGEYTPAAGRAQAFAVLNAANWLGFAAGNVATGFVVQHLSAAVGSVVAAIAPIVAAVSLVDLARRAPKQTRQAEETGAAETLGSLSGE